MRWYRNLQMMYKIVLPMGVMLTIALGLLTWQVQLRTSTAIKAVAERELAGIAGLYGNEVKGFLEIALNEGGALASVFGKSAEDKKPLSRDAMITAVRGIQRNNTAITATGIGCEPNAMGEPDANFKGSPGTDESGRFLPYIASGQPELEVLTDMSSSDWYQEPKRTLRAYLTEPYLYPVGNREILMTTASSPIVADGRFLGMVGVDISMERISTIVKDLKVYTSGRGAVVTNRGVFAAHTDEKLVNSSIFDSGLVSNAEGLRSAMRSGTPFMETNSINGRSSIIYYYPILFQATKQTWYMVISAPEDEVLAEAGEIRIVTLGISLAVLLLALLMIVVIVRINVRPLAALAGTARQIAAGNLRTAINDEGFGGEVRDLSDSLKEMIASLLENISKAEQMSADATAQTEKARQAMHDADEARKAAESAKQEGMLAAAGRLESVVRVVTSASRDLSAQIGASERGSSEQAARVAETATAMEEMNSTVMEVARNASDASEMSANTRAKAEEGAQIVQQAVSGIQNVQNVSLALKDDMAALADQARAISNIMAVISDIADQTNLLALNAAIEAARAGEAGRGFAVVADEVRKLAEKTMISTKDVGDSINTIQQSVDRSIKQVERAVDLIAVATEQSGSSGAALTEIVQMVDGSADQVRAIATASEQQASTSEEINRSISQVNEIAEETARTMQNAAAAVTELTRQAEELNRLIEDMKTSS